MENKDTRKIEIGPESLNHLNAIRKWTMFFSVIGFIFIGLMLIAGIIAGTFLSVFDTGNPGAGTTRWIMIVVFVAVAMVYYFPVRFLFRFSLHTRNAVQTTNKEELRLAFKNLRSFFVYLGILLIICLLLYFTVLIIAGTSMAFLKTYW